MLGLLSLLPKLLSFVDSVAESDAARFHEPKFELSNGVSFVAGLALRQSTLSDRVDVGLEIGSCEDGDDIFVRVEMVDRNRERVQERVTRGSLRLTDEDKLSSPFGSIVSMGQSQRSERMYKDEAVAKWWKRKTHSM